MDIRFATATWIKANGDKQRWFSANGKKYSIAENDGELALLDAKERPVSLKKASKILQTLAR